MPFPVDLPPAILALAAELKVQPQDVEENFVRGSGHGGQKVNKTSSTVQLKHVPTGIEVKVQDYREQSKNRIGAWKLLILKIEERVKGAESQIAREAFKIRKQKQRRSRKAKNKMLDDKSRQGDTKQQRRNIRDVLPETPL